MNHGCCRKCRAHSRAIVEENNRFLAVSSLRSFCRQPSGGVFTSASDLELCGAATPAPSPCSCWFRASGCWDALIVFFLLRDGDCIDSPMTISSASCGSLAFTQGVILSDLKRRERTLPGVPSCKKEHDTLINLKHCFMASACVAGKFVLSLRSLQQGVRETHKWLT